jgi:uncharacterized membrane protein YgaE (UPF0421/DUF939 family)
MDNKKIPLPGFRTIKTAIAVLACLLIYTLIGRENVLLALFATFICIQDSIRRSVQNGVNRVVGAVIGGMFGLLLLLVFSEVKEKVFLWYLVVSAGVIVLIYFLNLFKRNDSISMAAIVVLIVGLDKGLANPLMYTFNYVVDSIIGIVVAVGVNRLPLGNANEDGTFTECDNNSGKTRKRYKIRAKQKLRCKNCALTLEKTSGDCD